VRNVKKIKNGVDDVAKEHTHIKEPKKPKTRIDTKAIVDAAVNNYDGMVFPDKIFEGVIGEAAVAKAKEDYLKNIEKEEAAERESIRVRQELAKRGIVLEEQTPEHYLSGAYSDAQKREARRTYERDALLEANFQDLRHGRAAVSPSELIQGDKAARIPLSKEAKRNMELETLAEAHYQQAQARKAAEAESNGIASQQHGQGEAQSEQQMAGQDETHFEGRIAALADRFRPEPKPKSESHVARVVVKHVKSKIPQPKGKVSHAANLESEDERQLGATDPWADRAREEAESNMGFNRF
jgi:hypothetical protein